MFTEKTILIADADRVNAAISQLLFERRGARAFVTDNAAAAIELAHGGRFDLIIMENRLLGMSGVQASRRIRDLPGRAGETPILIVSSDVLHLRGLTCMDSGADGFVAKPFDFEDLLRMAELAMASPCRKDGAAVCRGCRAADCPAPASLSAPAPAGAG